MLVMVEGFDKYGPTNSNSTAVAALLTAGEWTSNTATLSIVAPLSATGFALNHSGGTVTYLSKTLSASYSRFIGGVRFASSLAQNAGISFGDAGTPQCSINVNTTGTISLKNGPYNTGTVVATSAASITANSTHYLEWDLTFTNTGAYQVWLDGVSILSGTGDLTATANNTANQIMIACSTGGSFTVDDLYLFDNTGTTNNAVLLTSPRIETQFPTGDGAVQFAVGAGILGSNAQKVTTANAPTAGSLNLRRFVPGANCTIASISIVANVTNGTSQWRGVVYTDSSGVPGTLMSSGSTVTGVTAGVTQTLPLTTPQALTGGTAYWLGFMNDTTLNMQLADGDSQSVRASATFASGAPGTAPAMTATFSFLMWGNLSAVSANWWQASRQPTAGSFSYNYEAAVGEEDLYTYPALSAPPSAIYAVAVKASVAKSDAGAKTVSMRLKSGATDSAGTGGTQAPGTSYGWLTSHYPLDPNGSVAWTLSALNAAQSGLKIET